VIRKVPALLVILVVVALPAAGRAAAWSARPAQFPKVFVERDVPITMSDGVVLYANVIHPANAAGAAVPGRFPVLLTQTPYNKIATGLNFEDDYLVQRGYVQVIADVRGTGSSEGAWTSFGEREQRDGYELAEWAASLKRPWSNGRVGLHGTSYGAINQIFTAAQHPKGVLAAFPIVPAGDTYRDVAVTGGQFDISFIPAWLGLVTGTSMIPPTYTPTNPAEAAKVLSQHATNVTAFQANTVAQGVVGGDPIYDGPFYRTRSPLEVIDKVRIPTFIVGGWYDLFQRGEPLLYQHLVRDHVPTRLLMGPWYHTSEAINSGLPADGVPSLDELELRWMDHYVRGVPDPTLNKDIAPVTVFRLGSGHYTRATSWPPKDVSYAPRFLSGNGLTGGSLIANSGAATGSDVVPWVPTAGLCSRSLAQWTAAGTMQGCEKDQRLNDLMGVHYDMPVTKDTLIAGPSSAHLFLTTNGRDAPLTVRLEDVAPDGTSTQLTAGWNLLSMRALTMSKTIKAGSWIVEPYHPFTKTSVLPTPAGQVMELWIEINPTTAVIPAGHTLRLAIQQTDTPHLAPSIPEQMSILGNMLTILHDRAHPSAVVIPFEQ
jgi:putative CocE/NonD family hydrolase